MAYFVLIPKYLTDKEVETLSNIANKSSSWQDGRQETGYQKISVKENKEVNDLILRALVELGKVDDFWDAWILKYPDGTFIPPHKDEASMFGRKHVRLNAVLVAPRSGGKFILDGQEVPIKCRDAIIFHPDEYEHSVSKVDGERLVFTVGCWI